MNALLYNLSSLSTINGVVRPGIVHRLDKDTSGLLVVAKNDEAHKNLQSQIQKKDAKRYYVALLDGNVKEDAGTINEPVGRSHSDRKKMTRGPSRATSAAVPRIGRRCSSSPTGPTASTP